MYGTNQLQLKRHAHATRNKNACARKICILRMLTCVITEFFDHCQ